MISDLPHSAAGGSRLEVRRRLEPQAFSLEQERPKVILIGALTLREFPACKDGSESRSCEAGQAQLEWW